MALSSQSHVPLTSIQVGDWREIKKVMRIEDVRSFAKISEDFNPVHLDEQFAQNSQFGGQIIHGLMAASLFSGLFGTKLPGVGCVYRKQSLHFKKPIYLNDEVLARIEVNDVNHSLNTVSFTTTCSVNGKIAIMGKAEVFCPAER